MQTVPATPHPDFHPSTPYLRLYKKFTLILSPERLDTLRLKLLGNGH